MDRSCTRCRRHFASSDLVKLVSKQMEADRKAAGLGGVRFLDYLCPCGADNIFVDILPMDGESAELYLERREEMEKVVRALHADRFDTVVVAVRESVTV